MHSNVPLNALRAFEAAARHMSIKLAADELGVTPSAVSHQLRILEEYFGVQLLKRSGASLELTATGQILAPGLRSGFSKILSSVNQVKEELNSGPLKLSVLPTFASRWLSPMLASYPLEKPGFELTLSMDQAPIELSDGTFDAALRYGKGNWPDTKSDLLFKETVSLFGLPQDQKQTEEDIRSYIASSVLILSEHKLDEFERWNMSLAGGPIKPASITYVDSVGLAVQAVIDGSGITFAGNEVCLYDIIAERIAPLFNHSIASDSGYYLVYSPAMARDRRIRNLRQLLYEEVEKQTERHLGFLKKAE